MSVPATAVNCTRSPNSGFSPAIHGRVSRQTFSRSDSSFVMAASRSVCAHASAGM